MENGYFATLLWSLLVFVSFLGYGKLLGKCLGDKSTHDIGWGLQAVWGMAVVLAVGGILMAFSVALAPVLALVVALGALAALGVAVQHALAGKFSFPARIPVAGLVAGIFAALALTASIAWPFQIDPNDDVVCYLFFPQKILQTGNLIEPFNVRRMGTYGGQSLLQALVMLVGNERSGHIPDRGFGMLMLFGLVLHATRTLDGRNLWIRLLILGVLILVPVPRINTGSSLTGAAVLLGLLATLDRASKPTWKNLLPAALLVAAAGALRPTYLVCAAGIVALAGLLQAWTSTPRPLDCLRGTARSVLPVAVLSAAILIPWMAVLWQSNATPLYPPFLGTMNPDFTVLGSKLGWLEDAVHATSLFFHPGMLALLCCMALACICPNKPLLIGAAMVAIAISWLTSYKFGVTVLQEGYRYTFPMLVPVALWILASAARTPLIAAPSSHPSYRVAIGGVAALLIGLNQPQGLLELRVMAQTLPMQMSQPMLLVHPALTQGVRQVQERTPPGSRILAAVDTPFAFDFARNDVVTLDVAGASTPGKWPLEQGPEALRAHLLGQGIRYVMASDFDNAMLLYTRRHWKEHHRPEWFFKEVWGRYMLDFMDSLDTLAQGKATLATAANLRLIDLQAPPQP